MTPKDESVEQPPSDVTKIPNSTWKDCGHPVYLGTSRCEFAGCGEAAGSEQKKAGAVSSGADFKLPPLQSRTVSISLEVFQQDWVPGFTAFLDDGELRETGKAHLMINIGSFVSCVESGELPPKDLPYLIAESLMHEAIHALEAWAKVEFSEEKIEELLQKYRKQYRTDDEKHWQYDPEEKRDNSNQFAAERTSAVAPGTGDDEKNVMWHKLVAAGFLCSNVQHLMGSSSSTACKVCDKLRRERERAVAPVEVPREKEK